MVIQKQSAQLEMKTTVVVLRIESGKAFWAHVGDSRLYYFDDGKLKSRTSDHSASQLAVLMGEITEEQIRFHSQRSRILRALGSSAAQPELSAETDIDDGKAAFLLCSDGFWEYVYEREMEQTLSNAPTPEQWLRDMEEILKSRVKPWNDNYSAIAVFA